MNSYRYLVHEPLNKANYDRYLRFALGTVRQGLQLLRLYYHLHFLLEKRVALHIRFEQQQSCRKSHAGAVVGRGGYNVLGHKNYL